MSSFALRRKSFRRLGGLTLAGTLALSTLAIGGSSATPPPTGPAGLTTSVNAPPLSGKAPAGALDAAGYWTAEKLRTAIPADNPAVLHAAKGDSPKSTPDSNAGKTAGVASHPVAPKLGSGNQTMADPVPSTAGKVFFTYNGRNYVCSASTINNNYKNLTITAGHCVHSGAGQGWHANIAFAPAYYNGQSGYGLWNWKTARAFTSWTNNSDFSHDQAFVTFHPRNGQNLVDAVGGNGLVWGNSPDQGGVRIWGWPAEPPYNGQVPYYCDGTSYRWYAGSTDAALPCTMNGGASGGPWLKDRINQNLGYVFAVTSRRTTSGTPLLLATPNSADVKSMFDQMT
ncbi:trypsin-like serine peptidase [Kribbella deserti]|uniref:Trypsin-like serine peptidase n=1 Tax=Kribbella deserti TaxID=1926257 RepID=A0ABV6QWW2_9ACTN